MGDGTRYSDWLANSVYGYGFGYSKEQALVEMASHVPDDAGPVEVDLVEHHGGASIGPSSWTVDEFVSGERIEIPAEEIEHLRDKSLQIAVATEAALAEAEKLADLEDDGQ